ncbi:MAG: glycosyltransferase family 1 protein [Bauldia sp.]
MKRVALLMPHRESWIGGVNYFRNLLHAVFALPDRQIDPLLLVREDTPDSVLDGFPAVHIVRSHAMGSSRPRSRLEKTLRKVLGPDHAKNRLLRQHDVAAVSHAGGLERPQFLPTISWLADFQHRHQPHFFSPAEVESRNRTYGGAVDHASLILVSSQCAERDLCAFFPAATPKVRVLRFVSGLVSGAAEPPREQIAGRYGIKAPFFHLPNQFWVHKNHKAVLDALAILKARGRPALVVSTGATNDYRDPTHFSTIQDEIRLKGLGEHFLILGVVPYPDLIALMRHSIAVINPSLFEGWSTTVEEAKSLGKQVILSDIPVHREQNPERAQYFAPHDPEGLADLIDRAQCDHSAETETRFQGFAQERLRDRFAAFGREYVTIALEAANRPRT